MKSGSFEAAKILRQYGIKPRKSYGQNFLVDPDGLRLIIESAELQSDETVLEVGAGLGILTNALSHWVRKVIAVEVDKRLAEIIKDLLEIPNKVEILQADVMNLNLEELFNQNPYLVVANIPYNITSALIRKFLESPSSPDRLILTVQDEVAQRAISTPGEMSLFSLSIQIFGLPMILGMLPPSSFFPQPRVNSAILRILPHDQPVVESRLIPWVFRLARSGFSQRRKQLHNSLEAGLRLPSDEVKKHLREASIDPRIRPQQLSLGDWVSLANVFQSEIGNSFE